MFTGIISDVGEVVACSGDGDTHLRIKTNYDTSSIDIGASIAHNGICLTVTDIQKNSYDVTASEHTASITTLGGWEVGTKLNLERALCLGEELGGHLVSGHVDGIATITVITEHDESRHFTIEAPAEFMPFIAPKGSVVLDGTSLTVTQVDDAKNQFSLALIPHTLDVTTWGSKQVGDTLNLEVDMIARYVARLESFKSV